MGSTALFATQSRLANQAISGSGGRDPYPYPYATGNYANLSPIAQRMQNLFGGFSNLLQPQGPGQQSLMGQFITQATNQQLQLTRQLAPRMQRLTNRLIRNDPILGRQQALAKKALNQQTSLLNQLQQVVSNPNQLDPATKRMVQNDIRSRFASLGTLDSGGAAMSEVTGVAQANLNATSQRISQILSALSGNQSVAAGGIPTTPGMSAQFSPFAQLGVGQGLQQGIGPSINAIGQLQMARMGNQAAGKQAFGQGLGSLLGIGLGAMFPGAAPVAAAAAPAAAGIGWGGFAQS